MKVIMVSTALVSSALSVKLKSDVNSHESLWETCTTSSECPSGKYCNGKSPFGKYCKED